MITGIDIGQARDPAAMCTLGRASSGAWSVLTSGRFPLDTSYETIAAYVADASRVGPVLVDRTGIGRAVVERSRALAGDRPIYGVTVHAGHHTRWSGQDVSVPKRDLVTATQAALQHQRLTVRGHSALIAELRSMTRKTNGKLEAAGAGHDDLAFALLMAMWAAERLDHREMSSSR